MTQPEVEKLLGPPRNEVGLQVVVWAPRKEGSVVSAYMGPRTAPIRFFPKREAEEGGNEYLWVGKSGLIALYVGSDGCLGEKYFSTVHPSEPSYLDLIRS